MDLSLSDTEQRLAESVRRFVDRAAPKDRLVDLRATRAASPADWATTMAAAGWLGLLIPSELGGSGATPTEAAMFFEEIGRAPLPPSWLLSSGVAAPLLAAAPAGEDRAAALAGIATGDIVLVPAFRSRDRRWIGLTAVASGRTVSHEFVFVCGLADATHLLTPVASHGSESLALIPVDHPAVEPRPLGGFLPDSYAVTVDDLDLDTVPRVPCAFNDAHAQRAMALAAAMISAYQVGSCSRLLEISVAHANERVQFGQLIGSFQRVQDHIVRIVNALDSARWILYEALSHADEASSGRRFAAKAWLARSAAIESHWECANAAHEVLAGIGSDPAHGTVLHTAMSRLLHDILGDPAYCRRRIAEAEGWA